MQVFAGLDVGAVSLKLSAIQIGDEPDSFSAKLRHHPDFFLAPNLPGYALRDRPIILSKYRRAHGNPQRAALTLLEAFYGVVRKEDLAGLRVTGASGRLAATLLGVPYENEFRALANGVLAAYPHVRTIFEIGGETSKYLRLDPNHTNGYLGIVDYRSSSDCAAGTGSFIDQQASRLGYSVEDVGRAACSANCSARIAGRCSVFAKTDMIHAQQRGYSTEQILRGLCEAVARNFKSSVVRGHPVVQPVALLGGVALNEGVSTALRELLKLRDGELFVPELHSWMGALGVALFALEGACRPKPHPVASVIPTNNRLSPECAAPLSMENVVLLRDRVLPFMLPDSGPPVPAYLGIDIGSVSTNLVVIDEDGRLLKEIYVPTAGRPIEVVEAGLREIAAELGPRLDIRGVGTTGSGRELIGELVGADTVNDEITAHKTGALHVSRQLGMEPVDTIFEIGGQDSKFISLDNGIVVDFTMNEACAAGTGSFLEEQAEKLGVAIKGEFAQRALCSSAPTRLGERCTVFMERDVTGLLARGAAVNDLCAGLAYSVAINYLNRVVRGRRIGCVIYFQGGTAYNDAVAAAFSQVLGKQIIVPPHNGVIGAIGMALIAQQHTAGGRATSHFRGYDLGRTRVSSRDFVCQACSNLCEMKEFTIGGEKSYWGDKCSDKFRKRARAERQPVIRDLIAYRDGRFESFAQPSMRMDGPVVGIPRALSTYDRLPFWSTYFRELGCNVQVSPVTDSRLARRGEELAVAQPCSPVQVAHAHVEFLLSGECDVLFVPNIVDSESPALAVNSHLCPWNQTLPFVLRSAPQMAELPAKLLSPTLHFRLGERQVRRALRPIAHRLGRTSLENDRAVSLAYEAQRAFKRDLLEQGAQALQVLAASGEPGIVLLGRPYNLYDRNANCDIPRKLRTLYGVNVLPLDFLPVDDEDISAVHENMFWNSGRQILAAAQITRSNPNLHWICLSNFKCGPDSYIKSFLSEASRKPGLFLQFDAHSNDAGYLTRCEAYLDSKGVLRCSHAVINA